MAQDNLERFILSNREAFDDDVPGLRVWANIERQLPPERSNRFSLLKISKIAAAILVLISFGAFLGIYFTGGNQLSSIAQIDDINPELIELERFYQKEIQEKINVLVSYEQDPGVIEDIEQLDNTMKELKNELSIAPDGKEEEIIENLIKTYQTKIFILERVLSRLSTTNHKNVVPHESEISI